MNRIIRFADLECLLFRLGFQRGETTGPQLLFEHPDSETLLVFPPYRSEEPVQPHHVAKAQTLLDSRGLLERTDFDKRLDEIVDTTDCSPDTEGTESSSARPQASVPEAAA